MIYLLHFTVHLGRAGSSGADHYLGFCPEDGLEHRLEDHRSGQGAKITRAVIERGGDLVLVRTWPNGGRALERYLKNNGHLAKHCPICRGRHLKSQREQWRRRARALSHQLELPYSRPRTGSGGDSPLRSTTVPPSALAGLYPPAPRQESGTGFGESAPAQESGGTSSTAPAPRSSRGGT